MRWIRLVCFLLIFCIGFGVLNAILPDQASNRWNNFYDLAPNSLDIVFIGNSHNFNAFNPEIIDSILNTNSSVVGTSGENIIVSYYELKEVLKSQQPSAVVLESYALDLLPDDMIREAHIFKFLDAGRLTENKVGVIAQILYPDHLAGVFPVFRERLQWEKPHIYFDYLMRKIKGWENEKKTSDDDPKINFFVIPTEKYEQALSLQKPNALTPPQKNLDYLEKFISVCQENNITPFFAAAPILSVPERTYDVYAPMDKDLLSKQYGVDYFDFNQYPLSQLHFINSDHVNNFGALIVSTETAVNLSKALGIPLNQEALEYYRTFYFDNFDISQPGEKTTLTLFPSNPDAPLLYAWKVTRGKKVLMDTDYQLQNFIDFSTSKAGEYQIQVQVWNPDGDFVLEGLFFHDVEEEEE